MTVLTDAQFALERERCENCVKKPCLEACPVGCSPAAFLLAAQGYPSDFLRSAAMILKQNPLGGVCGTVCPEKHCMRACSHAAFDRAVNIPALQAYIIEKGRDNVEQAFGAPMPVSKKVAVIGDGPAGLAACAMLAAHGLEVTLLIQPEHAHMGGACALIPEPRLARETLQRDLDFCLRSVQTLTVPDAFAAASEPGAYDGVIVATGRWQALTLPIAGAELTLNSLEVLAHPQTFPQLNGRVAIIGGGGVAVDCAMTAFEHGALAVELFSLENFAELPLAARERAVFQRPDFVHHARQRVRAIRPEKQGHAQNYTLELEQLRLAPETPFSPEAMQALAGSEFALHGFDCVIMAIGSRPAPHPDIDAIFAGDCQQASTVVEAVASGKKAAFVLLERLGLHAFPEQAERQPLPTHHSLPVSLETHFFGIPVTSPLFLSAAPPSDGLEPMRKAYAAGWAGGIMKTCFDNIPIHTPAAYMHRFSSRSFGNCDSVSAQSLDARCREIEQLRREFPDRLTMASTGGEISGDDVRDCADWQRCTRKLESAGAQAIEYSLSCPGSDAIGALAVNQDIARTCTIIEWILQAANPEIPKLFKLTSSVASIVPFVQAVQSVLARYPQCKAGITLGDTLPVLVMQKRSPRLWEDGVCMGMGGAAITPVNLFTLASACAGMGTAPVPISGSGGVMSYRDAAQYLALGVNSVQICSLVMRHGYDVLHELHSGLSWLMQERGIASIDALRGIASPVVLPFEQLPTQKQIPQTDSERCARCGNCTRCPAQAVVPTPDGPSFRADRCIGCTFCTLVCFTGALSMRDRSPEEQAQTPV